MMICITQGPTIKLNNLKQKQNKYLSPQMHQSFCDQEYPEVSSSRLFELMIGSSFSSKSMLSWTLSDVM